MAQQAAIHVVEEIQHALQQFYDALNAMLTGDLNPMREIWSRADDVTMAGPFGGCRYGYREVMEEFEGAARLQLGGFVEPQEMHVVAAGDLGYSICRERGRNMTAGGRSFDVDHRATSIFRRENGRFKLIHHHTDLSPALEQARSH